MQPAGDRELALLIEQVLDAAIELQGADFGDVSFMTPETASCQLSRIEVRAGMECIASRPSILFF